MGRVGRNLSSGRSRPTFDFTLHMRTLCGDIISRLPELAHIDVRLVALRVCQARKAVNHGLHASLTPLRFEGGSRTLLRRGRTWTIQPIFDGGGREMLYLLSFYLPRFCDQPLAEKLATVVHELWHIGPEFNGDIRRLPGRCFAHGRSEESFHRDMKALARRWLADSPASELYDFLRFGFVELRERFGAIVGTRIPTPKLLPMSERPSGDRVA